MIVFSKPRAFFLVLLAPLVITLLLYQHFYDGPIWLMNQYPSTASELSKQSTFRLYNLPYILYLPYSLINYLVIGVPLVSVGLYSALGDLIASGYQRVSLLDNISKLSEDYNPMGIDADMHKSCLYILRHFEAFAFRLMEVVSGYSSFVLVFVAMVTFEFHIGKRVLYDFGWTLSLVGYSLIMLSFAIIFLCFYRILMFTMNAARRFLHLDARTIAILKKIMDL